MWWIGGVFFLVCSPHCQSPPRLLHFDKGDLYKPSCSTGFDMVSEQEVSWSYPLRQIFSMTFFEADDGHADVFSVEKRGFVLDASLTVPLPKSSGLFLG